MYYSCEVFLYRGIFVYIIFTSYVDMRRCVVIWYYRIEVKIPKNLKIAKNIVFDAVKN